MCKQATDEKEGTKDNEIEGFSSIHLHVTVKKINNIELEKSQSSSSRLGAVDAVDSSRDNQLGQCSIEIP